MNVITLEILGSDQRPIRADLHRAADGEAAPLVLCAHGFKGFRAWGFWPYICERLAAAGFHALRLDYSHNGVEAHDFADFAPRDAAVARDCTRSPVTPSSATSAW